MKETPKRPLPKLAQPGVQLHHAAHIPLLSHGGTVCRFQ